MGNTGLGCPAFPISRELLLWLEVLESFGDAACAGEYGHLGVVDDLALAWRRGVEAKLAQLMVDAEEITIECDGFVADAERHGGGGAAFDHVREVHGNVDAGSRFHVEASAA